MNSSAGWTLKVRNGVYKTLAKFPKNDCARLTRVIEELPLDPYHGDIEKMEGEDKSWRRRIGAYRIFYEIIPQAKVIYVFRVERRTSGTY